VTAETHPVTRYLFPPFELDVVRGCLRCNGEELPLRHQSFYLLHYFLEHPGVILTKNQLTEAIWNDTSVTDNALVQCVTEIRRDLNDDPQNPRYIKTVSKVGYRFIADVEAIRAPAPAPAAESQRISIVHPAHPSEAPRSPGEHTADEQANVVRIQTQVPGRWRLVALSIIALVLLVASGDKTPSNGVVSRRSSAHAGPPILAVFSFSNDTGRADLDWLREGLSDMILTDLAHTRKWNVLSRETTDSLLGDGSTNSLTKLPKALTAAQSVHATEFIMGNLSASGEQVTIQVETRDGQDGHLVASDTALLNDPREIVAQAELLATGISRHLGFATDNAPPLADVMTSNVEAYRYYSLGVEKAEQFQNAQAIELFKKAIGFDPKFSMAYARIGYAYAVQDFQPEKARPYLERAQHYSNALPAMNRLYIEAWSAIARSDFNAAIGILKQIISQYPDETEAYCQLSRIERGQERIEEATTLLRQAIERNPDAKDLYNAYGLILLSMEHPQDAIGAYRQYVALAPQNPNAHDSLGMAYELAGQYDAALAEYSEALRFDPEFEPSIVHLGDTYYQQGRYRDALREYRRYIQVSDASEAKAIGYGDLATVYLTIGKLEDAESAANSEMSNHHNAVWNSLLIALRKHQQARARELEATLFANLPNPERGSPRDLRTEFFYRGSIELNKGDSQSAIAYFKSALQHLPPSSGIDMHEDCLANAYLQLGMYSDAVAEYQRILKLNPSYPLAYFHIGQAYQKIGDHQAATAALKHFLQANQSADQDTPAVLEANSDLR
jgi:tetratricopeptide (TPR) repeat protein/DNA-binding winged helix-turn-helix (wHTH) protein